MSNIAIRYCRNKDSAMQGINTGFLKVLQNIGRYDDKHSIATFIRHILINHLIDEYRKEKKYHEAHVEIDGHAEAEHYSVNEAELKLDAAELISMMNELPEITGKVFNLFAVDGFRHAEISQMLGISEGTSRWHVNEARKLLKSKIEATQIETRLILNR